MNTGLTLPFATRVAIAARTKTPRYSVWMVPAGGAGRGIPEHDPRHKEAVKVALMGGQARFILDGAEFTVREA